MLPWLFGVLLLLNVGLFLWGYQREKALEPDVPPVPEGRYEIRLLSEVEGSGGGQIPEPAAESSGLLDPFAPASEAEPAVDGEPVENGEPAPAPAPGQPVGETGTESEPAAPAERPPEAVAEPREEEAEQGRDGAVDAPAGDGSGYVTPNETVQGAADAATDEEPIVAEPHPETRDQGTGEPIPNDPESEPTGPRIEDAETPTEASPATDPGVDRPWPDGQ